MCMMIDFDCQINQIKNCLRHLVLHIFGSTYEGNSKEELTRGKE